MHLACEMKTFVGKRVLFTKACRRFNAIVVEVIFWSK